MDKIKLSTGDYRFAVAVVESNGYFSEEWERDRAKAVLISAIRWGREQDELNKERRKQLKRDGKVL